MFGPLTDFVLPGILVGTPQQVIDRLGEYERAGAEWVILALRAPVRLGRAGGVHPLRHAYVRGSTGVTPVAGETRLPALRSSLRRAGERAASHARFETRANRCGSRPAPSPPPP